MWEPRCPACGARGRAPCGRCAAALAPAPAPHGDPSIVAAFAFDGPGRRLVLALKYGNDRACVATVARAMARRVVPGSVDMVTWAPTSPARRRSRGFDQAEVLARAVARCLGAPCRSLLERTSHEPQTGHTRRARLQGPSFRARGAIQGRVLVVDDVATTGATLRAAAGTLRAAGATSVRCVVAAETPAAWPERPPVDWRPS